MFTGIITDIGTIEHAEQRGDLHARIRCQYDMASVAIGASIACSGACLTVTSKGDDWFTVDISAETVSKTAANRWVQGKRLNLERALKIGDELGGHIVTGHVDGVGTVAAREAEGDSIRFTIAAPAALAPYISAKGSITVDGVSLTVNSHADQSDGTVHFGLNIIPHTWEMTTLGELQPGDPVNLEIDVLARYLMRMNEAKSLSM